MRIEVTLELHGKLLDRFEFDSPRGDLISGFAAASTRFRRNHPDLSLADAGVSIRLSRADAAADAAQSAARVTADPI